MSYSSSVTWLAELQPVGCPPSQSEMLVQVDGGGGFTEPEALPCPVPPLSWSFEVSVELALHSMILLD